MEKIHKPKESMHKIFHTRQENAHRAQLCKMKSGRDSAGEKNKKYKVVNPNPNRFYYNLLFGLRATTAFFSPAISSLEKILYLHS